MRGESLTETTLNSFSDIEFTFISNDGTTSTPAVKLTSNTGTGQTYDYAPSLAVTSNGTIGIAWYRWLVDNNTGLNNYNIYFATITQTGALLSGPVNVTNNNLWDDFNNLNVPHFFNVTVAGTSNNNFIVSWEDYRTDGATTYDSDIWYTVLDSSGTMYLHQRHSRVCKPATTRCSTPWMTEMPSSHLLPTTATPIILITL